MFCGLIDNKKHNLDSSGKSKQDQLSGTVHLGVLVHHRRRRSRFSRLMTGFVQHNGNMLHDHGAFSGQSVWKLGVQMCEKVIRDLGQWANSNALYRPSETALITGCGIPWTTTTSLPSTSFPIAFDNPPYGRNWTYWQYTGQFDKLVSNWQL